MSARYFSTSPRDILRVIDFSVGNLAQRGDGGLVVALDERFAALFAPADGPPRRRGMVSAKRLGNPLQTVFNGYASQSRSPESRPCLPTRAWPKRREEHVYSRPSYPVKRARGSGSFRLGRGLRFPRAAAAAEVAIDRGGALRFHGMARVRGVGICFGEPAWGFDADRVRCAPCGPRLCQSAAPIVAGQFAAARTRFCGVGDAVSFCRGQHQSDSRRTATGGPPKRCLKRWAGHTCSMWVAGWALGEGMPDAGEWGAKNTRCFAPAPIGFSKTLLQLDRILMESPPRPCSRHLDAVEQLGRLRRCADVPALAGSAA